MDTQAYGDIPVGADTPPITLSRQVKRATMREELKAIRHAERLQPKRMRGGNRSQRRAK